MYELVNEANLIISFDMDVELSEYGVFGVYVRQGYNTCSGYIDPSDWTGIENGYKELINLYQTCKGQATFCYCLTGGGNKVVFSLDYKGGLKIEVNIVDFNYRGEMTVEGLDQTYLPKFINFFKEFLERKPIDKYNEIQYRE